MGENLFLQMNRPGEEPTETAKKHATAVCTLDHPEADQPFGLSLRVGAIEHPMENGHHIQFVELFVNDLYVSRVDFTPVVSAPEATLTLRLPAGTHALRAVSRCNLHGLWESVKEIEVVG